MVVPSVILRGQHHRVPQSEMSKCIVVMDSGRQIKSVPPGALNSLWARATSPGGHGGNWMCLDRYEEREAGIALADFKPITCCLMASCYSSRA
jgi:hypothetical protein